MGVNTKIFVVGSQKHYAQWTGFTLVPSIHQADIVMFTGGEDVNPELYGEKVGDFTSINKKRDIEEEAIFKQATKMNKKMIGICRGAQFLTVMSGGKLIQHVNNHGVSRGHGMYNTLTNDIINITSTHHQMLYPFNMEKNLYQIIGYSADQLSNTYLNGDNEEIMLPKDFVEPEIVLYKNTNALAIQCHPEMMREYSKDLKQIKDILINFSQIKKFKI